jgi:hypothetical protein
MIRPLDLQTLYMNLEKVGKEQAQSKEAAALAQSHQVEKLQREHDQEQHAVVRTNATAEPEQGTKVDAEGRGTQGQPREARRQNEAEEGQDKEKEADAWSDPELGKHVDLSG